MLLEPKSLLRSDENRLEPGEMTEVEADVVSWAVESAETMSVAAVVESAPVDVNAPKKEGKTDEDDTALDDRVLRVLRSAEDEIVGSESVEISVLVGLIEDSD